MLAISPAYAGVSEADQSFPANFVGAPRRRFAERGNEVLSPGHLTVGQNHNAIVRDQLTVEVGPCAVAQFDLLEVIQLLQDSLDVLDRRLTNDVPADA